MKLHKLLLVLASAGAISCAEKKPVSELEQTPLPSLLTANNTDWEIQKELSDDFNYVHKPANEKINFGENNKWYNFYHNGWDGPGTTYWKYNHVFVDGKELVLKASRWNKENELSPASPWPNKMGKSNQGVNAGCITSNSKVLYPVFVEARVSVADIALASDVWLLSPDDTQEIDIIECYGGKDPGNAYFSQFIHLSHHSFIREPFTDYQPRDLGSWHKREGVTSWGEFSWNNGERQYVNIGVNWVSPKHFEYYIDGKLERVLYDKAVATKQNGKWNYGYPTMTDGKLDFNGGYQKITNNSTSETYSLDELKKADAKSKVSIIDPYNYQGGKGFTKELDIIINIESQNWHVFDGRTPTDSDLADETKNTMKVDWLRVFKPKTK